MARTKASARRFEVRIDIWLNPDHLPLAALDYVPLDRPVSTRRFAARDMREAIEVGRRNLGWESGTGVTVEIESGGEVVAHVAPNGSVWEGRSRDSTRETRRIEGMEGG